jgi:hypothetical protein
MTLPTILRSLVCLIRGHAPIVEINESENKADLVCERCHRNLGNFINVLRKHRVAPESTRPVNDSGVEISQGSRRKQSVAIA